jgi:putative PIN family toxin of toxin-antitoxin system
LRVFLDTNVLVSAFAARGLCADLFQLVLLEHELILGRSVLRELSEALQRKIKLPARDVTAIVAFLSDEATELVESSDPVAATVDRDDAIVLGDAVIGHAQVFVTGDAKILDLGRHGDLRIASPRAFWELLQTQKSRRT